jgi:adenosylhomocysteine nucleosidase/adenosylhomocysteine/aminodeoxyfutalosine nucleosidase
MKSPIAIIGALDEEIQAYLEVMQEQTFVQWNAIRFYQGQLFGQEVVVVKSGVGKVFAAMVTQKLIDTYQPKAILFTGVAGGLNPNYAVGDIVVAHDCIQHDLNTTALGIPRGHVPYTSYRFFETDTQLKTLALAAKSEHTIHCGRIVTGDQFLTHKEMQQYDYLTTELAGDAVEMEGAAVGFVCTVNEVPFLIIRTISDKADAEASTSYVEFLPLVAHNSVEMVAQIFSQYSITSKSD